MIHLSNLVEDPHAWLELAEQPLIAALTGGSTGTETNAGRGLFREEPDTSSAPSPEAQRGRGNFVQGRPGCRCESTDDKQQGTMFAGDMAADAADLGQAKTQNIASYAVSSFPA